MAPSAFACVSIHFSSVQRMCVMSLGQLQDTSQSCALTRNTRGKGVNVYEYAMKGVFVQLGSSWQGRCQLCPSDRIFGGLGESYNRETQRRSRTKKPKSGQRCYLLKQPADVAVYLHGSIWLGHEFSPPNYRLSLGCLNEEDGHKFTCPQLLLQTSEG